MENISRLQRQPIEPLSIWRLSYEWMIIAVLLVVPLLAVILYGGVHIWSFGPFIFITFFASACLLLRPFLFHKSVAFRFPYGFLGYFLFALYGCFLMVLSDVPYEARNEVLKVFSYVLALWLWTELTSTRSRWRIFIGMLLFVVTLLAWYAIIQHSNGNNIVLFRERPEVYGERASGTYICPNHFASLLGILIPIAISVLLATQAGLVLRILSAYAVLLFLPSIYLTQSRSGWLGLMVGITITSCMLAFRVSKKLFVKFVLLIPMLCIFAAGLLWTISPMVKERVSGAMLSDPDDAVLVRLLMWKDTLEMIKDAPIVGSGIGGYAWLYKKYQTHGLQFWFDYAHNEYLQLLSEYGVIGFSLLSFCFLLIGYRFLLIVGTCKRNKDAFFISGVLGALGASLVHACFDFNLHIFSINHVLIMCMGIANGGLYLSGDLTSMRWNKARPAILLFPIILLLFGMWNVLKPTLSDLYLRRGEVYREQLQLDKAFTYYEKAAWIDSRNWKAYLKKGEVLLLKSYWALKNKNSEQKEALKLSYEEALRKNPYDMDVWLGLSRFYSLDGDVDKAVELLEHVIGFAHHDFYYLVQSGIRLKNLGALERAHEVFLQAKGVGSSETLTLNLKEVKKRLSNK